MNVERALSYYDFENAARRRLPKVIYEMIGSGVDSDKAPDRNVAAFERWRLMPRYLVDITARKLTTELFGKPRALPFGISPTGMADLVRRGADIGTAVAAAKAGVPSILSGHSVASVERVAEASSGNAWFQLYPTRDRKYSIDLMRRCAAAGVDTLVMTVDQPVYPNRETDSRNGFKVPLKITPRLVIDGLMHPAWLREYIFSGGMPVMETWAPYAGRDARPMEITAFVRSQHPAPQTWDDVRRFRDVWKGNLVIKGLLHPDDAEKAVENGADGIIVSNHGGKVCEVLPSPIEVLPAVVAAVGERTTVMLDSGIRRGSDVIVARCLGARFVFVGRAGIYAAAAAGQAGVSRMIEILRSEVDIGLAQIGCTEVDKLDETFLASPVP